MGTSSPEIRIDMNDTEWAYLAGIIDGEGCIRLANCGYAKRRVIDLRIYNTDVRLIEWLRDNLGGYAYAHNKKAHVCWQVHWSSKRAKVIIEHVLPYLIVKKEQAEIALSFQRLIGKNGQRVSSDNLSKRDVLLEAMSILNGWQRVNKQTSKVN